MTAESMIDYEALAQEAMRNVVRTVLTETAEKGLPGDHHFYISFDTLAPGVILSKRLREKYAEEMTIVLQHRFWDLTVNDQRFEVKLTFDGIPERLVVPFKAIRVFFDPSVRYGLQFESVASAMDRAREADDLDDHFDDPFADRDLDTAGRGGLTMRRDGPSRRGELAPAGAGKPQPSRPKYRPRMKETVSDAESGEANPPGNEDAEVATDVGTEEAQAAERGAEIVSLDAFRKK